jgi:GGDEF domain-containing protein
MPHDVDRILGLPPEERTLPQILHLSELLVQLLARERPEVLSELMVVANRYCRLKPRQLESLVALVQDKVQQLANVLSLDLADDLDYTQVLVQAQTQLSEVAESVARDGVSGLAADENVSRASRELATVMEHAVAGQGETNPHTEAVSTAVASEPALDDVGLMGRVTAALALSRQARTPVSLAMVAVDDYEQLVVTRGVEAGQSYVRLLETAARKLCHDRGDCLHLGDGQFAVILENHDRAKAVETGRRLIRGMHRWSELQSSRGMSAVTVSAGVATLGLTPRNFPARELIDAASRCLFAAQASGGDVLKSIDLC